MVSVFHSAYPGSMYENGLAEQNDTGFVRFTDDGSARMAQSRDEETNP